MKNLLILILQAMDLEEAGKVIIKMEKQITQMENIAQAELLSNTVIESKQAYRQ